MSERVQKLVSQNMEKMPWMGTFHSIGAKIIRNHAEVIGLKQSFTILDKDDQLSLIKQIIKAENLDQSQFSPKLIQSKICLLYTSPSPRDKRQSRMPSSA